MNSKTILGLHLIGQILAQTAVIEIVPAQYKPYFAALVATIGVIIAFFDTTHTDKFTQTGQGSRGQKK